jgi:hypothetical protein
VCAIQTGDHRERCTLCGAPGATRPLAVFSPNFIDLVGCHPGTDPLTIGHLDGTLETSNKQGLLDGLSVESVCGRCRDELRNNIDLVAHQSLSDISARFVRVATAFDLECIARWSLKTTLLAASASPQDPAPNVCGLVCDLVQGKAIPRGTVILATGMREGEVAKVQFRALCAIDPELPTEIHGVFGIVGLQNMTIFVIYGADEEISDGIITFFESAASSLPCTRLWPRESAEVSFPLSPRASADDIAAIYQSFGTAGEVYRSPEDA